MLAALLWQRLEFFSLALAIAAAALAALLWLYPNQLTGATRRWRWMLPVLRGVVIVALAASLLRPVAARPKLQFAAGPIVFLVDQSLSMQTNDAGRTPSEKIRLAEAFGLVGVRQRGVPTAALRADLQIARSLMDRVSRNRVEAEYARLSDRGVESARRRLEESTAALRDAAIALADHGAKLKNQADLSHRLAEFRLLPASLDEQALRDLRAKLDRVSGAIIVAETAADASAYDSDPRTRAQCDDLDRLSRAQLATKAIFDPTTGLKAKLPAGTPVIIYGFTARTHPLAAESPANRSDILGAVQSVRERYRGRPIQAIVLITDGRQVGGDLDMLRTLDGSPPVFTIGVAATHERKDVSIIAIRGLHAAFVGESVPIRVDLRATGCRGEQIEITLDGAGDRQTQRLTVGDSTNVFAEFRVTFGAPGPAKLAVTVAPVRGEATEANNHGDLWLSVVNQTVPVMVASTGAAREFAAITEALGAAPWISLKHAVLSGDAEMALPLTPDEIMAQSVLVFVDLHVWSLSDAQWDAVERLVSERGGSVIFEISDPRVLHEYEQHRVASRLLPFDPVADVLWREWPGDQPHYVLARVPGPPGSSQTPRWPRLPAVTRFLAMPQLKPNAQPLLIERATGAAALAQTRLGLGRAFLMGIDDTWRWQNTSTTQPADFFWGRFVRAAIEEPYAAQQANYTLDAGQIVIEPTEPLHVRAKTLQDDGTPSPAGPPELEILRDGRIISAVSMTESGNLGPGRYEATLAELPEGQYELRLAASDDLSEPPHLAIRVAASSAAELADLSGDNRLLRRIAESTGGEFFTLDQLPLLPPRLAELRERQNQWVEYPLWNSPYLFLFVLSGLSLEWALRKQAGLP